MAGSTNAVASAVRVGCDVVDVSRIDLLLRTYPDDCLGDVFSEAELRGGSAADLARVFAVKEAVLKAVGTGVAMGLSLRDVEVGLGCDGVAEARLRRALARVAELYAIEARTFLDEGFASAVVLLARKVDSRCAIC